MYSRSVSIMLEKRSELSGPSCRTPPVAASELNKKGTKRSWSTSFYSLYF